MRRTEIILYSSVSNHGTLFTGKCHWKYIIKLIDFVIFPGKRTPLIHGNFVLSEVNVSFEVLTEHKISGKVKMFLSVN